jgi:hypothetical protein
MREPSLLVIPTIGPTIDFRTSIWIQNTWLPRVNGAVAAGANSNHWQFVSGLSSDFARHGMCAGEEAWVNTFWKAMNVQGPFRTKILPPFLETSSGTLHMNLRGHQAQADRLVRAMGHDPAIRPIVTVVHGRDVPAGVAGAITVRVQHSQRGVVKGKARIDGDANWFATDSPYMVTLHGADHRLIVETEEYGTLGGSFKLPLQTLTVHYLPESIDNGKPTDLKVWAVDASGRHIDGVVHINSAQADEVVSRTDSVIRGFVLQTRGLTLKNRRKGGVRRIVIGPSGHVFPISPDFDQTSFSFVPDDGLIDLALSGGLQDAQVDADVVDDATPAAKKAKEKASWTDKPKVKTPAAITP